MYSLTLDGIDMMAILLINNLCSRLTILHWRPWHIIGNDDNVISVVKACPNLGIRVPFHKDIFHHPPPTAEHLEARALLVLQSFIPG
jgi:hypothetical protein